MMLYPEFRPWNQDKANGRRDPEMHLRAVVGVDRSVRTQVGVALQKILCHDSPMPTRNTRKANLASPRMSVRPMAPACLGRLCSIVCAGSFVMTIGLGDAVPPSPMTPAAEQKTFVLADPRLVVELVASEPELASPVAMAWDPDARLFVAEMRDYPKGTGKGTVRMLEDRDGDGRYERSTLFADQLPFPNSVLPWNGGVLVTAAPDIWFLKDLDGDGRADERRVLLTGFGQGNQQLRVNGLFWGHDNWIYGANGRSDGQVRWSEAEVARGAPGSMVSLRGHDFRFRPDTHQFETLAGRSQFGHCEDDAGRRFLSWNTIPIRHAVFPESYLARQPALAGQEVLVDVFPAEDDKRVFQISPLPRIFNEEPAGYFNASCGLTILRAGGLGPAYRGNAFTCEPLRNLVHRRVLNPTGPTFVAERAESDKEFLASKDPWFHPVNLATGPDGALYVADFYRQWVEHPDFVHDKSQIDKFDWRTGAEHGRIWRIREPSDRPKTPQPKLSKANLPGLLQSLSHENAWWRMTAQQLIVERRYPDASPALRVLARQASKAPARLHALWSLEGLGSLTGSTILEALEDEQPAIREHAVRVSESIVRADTEPDKTGISGSIRTALCLRANDVDARVRLRLALTLGSWSGNEQLRALVALARNDATNSWHALAIASSSGAHPALLLEEFTKKGSDKFTEPEMGFLDQLAVLVGGRESASALHNCAAGAAALPGDVQAAIMAGLSEGLRKAGRPLIDPSNESPAHSSDLVSAMQPFVRAAGDQARNSGISRATRLRWIRFLGEIRPSSVVDTMLSLLRPGNEVEIQLQALSSLLSLSDASVAGALVSRWDQWPRNVRKRIVTVAPRNNDLASALLTGLEGGAIQLLEIDPASRQAFLNVNDVGLRTRASKALSNLNSSDRETVLRSFQPSLALSGEVHHGATLFANSCLPCHTIQDRGGRVGPDLTGVGTHTKESLLIDILDPSRQAQPDFLAYNLTTLSGESFNALVEDETSDAVTLRMVGVPDTVIPRSKIKELKASGKSLMPEGLEQGLSQQDMADLVEFLRKPDKSLLPKQ